MPFCDKKSRVHRLKCRLWCWLILVLLAVQSTLADGRLNLNFDPDWKFIKADPPNASALDFDDHEWSSVSLPHTFNDIDTFDDWSSPNHVGEMNLCGVREVMRH